MTFALEAESQDVQKRYLVRIVARKALGVGTFVSGSDYSFDVDPFYQVTAAYVLGSSATFTRQTNTITVTSASDLTNPANWVVIEHALYLTNETAIATSGLSGIPDANWEPRLVSAPTAGQSMRDVIEGVFSLTLSSIVIASDDGFYQKIVGPNDSLSNAEVTGWLCLNGLENNKKFFDGLVTSVSYQTNVITLNVVDSFLKLKKTATFGTREQAFNFVGNSARPYPPPGSGDRAIPMTFGYGSPCFVKPGYRHLDAYGNTIGQMYHVYEGLQAVPFSPEEPGDTDVVSFSAGRIAASGLRLINLGTIIQAHREIIVKEIPRDPTVVTGAADKNIEIWEEIVHLYCSSFNVQIGDYIPDVIGTRGGNVCQIGNYGFGSYNVAIIMQNFGGNETIGTAPSSGTISVTVANNTYPCMSVWLDSGDNVENLHQYIPLALVPDTRRTVHGRRYLPFTASIVPYTLNGRTVNHVNFTVDPVEANITTNEQSGSTVSQLKNGIVKYCYRLASPVNQAEDLKWIIETSGLTTDAASFTAAESLDTPLALTWPFEGDQFTEYLSLCQKIVNSTFGILYANDDREIGYKLIESGGTAVSVRSDEDIIVNSASSAIEFQDMYDRVIFSNGQFALEEVKDNIAMTATSSDEKAAFLHQISRVKYYDHRLRILTGVPDRVAGYLKNPSIVYNISTMAKDSATKIGDVITIESDVVANETGSSDCVVVSIDDQGSQINVRLNEIRGVP